MDKKIYGGIIVVLLLVVLGMGLYIKKIQAGPKTACNASNVSSNDSNPENTGTQTAVSATTTSKQPDLSMYWPWIIQKDRLNDKLLNSEIDEVSIATAGDRLAGDILSSLIVDEAMRKQLKLKKLTPDYTYTLERRLASYSEQMYNYGFYALYVKHIDGLGDVVSGLARADRINDVNKNKIKELVLLVKPNIILPLSVPYHGNTATGAEAGLCSASYDAQKKTIAWKCFSGLEGNSEKGIIGSEYNIYNIDVNDGSIIDKNVIVEKN